MLGGVVAGGERPPATRLAVRLIISNADMRVVQGRSKVFTDNNDLIHRIWTIEKFPDDS
jgi:hypothetical protein